MDVGGMSVVFSAQSFGLCARGFIQHGIEEDLFLNPDLLFYFEKRFVLWCHISGLLTQCEFTSTVTLHFVLTLTLV